METRFLHWKQNFQFRNFSCQKNMFLALLGHRKFHVTYIIQLFFKPIMISWSNFYQLHVLMLTIRTHDIMILAGMNDKLASENFFWKWMSLTEGENDEMSIPNSRDKIAIETDRADITTICKLSYLKELVILKVRALIYGLPFNRRIWKDKNYFES